MGDQDFYYAVDAECRRLVKEMAEIERSRQEIERLGYTKARLIQRKGYKGKKNYHLSHSAKSDWVRSGKPRLEYVGTKPEKIQAAQERVARMTHDSGCADPLTSSARPVPRWIAVVVLPPPLWRG